MTEFGIRQNICSNIAKYRKEAGMSQTQLAEYLKVSRSNVSTWERGVNPPDIETLFEICKLFKVKLSDMYGCDSIDTAEQLTVHGFEKDLVISYRKADELDKEIVKRTLKLDSKAPNQKNA